MERMSAFARLVAMFLLISSCAWAAPVDPKFLSNDVIRYVTNCAYPDVATHGAAPGYACDEKKPQVEGLDKFVQHMVKLAANPASAELKAKFEATEQHRIDAIKRTASLTSISTPKSTVSSLSAKRELLQRRPSTGELQMTGTLAELQADTATKKSCSLPFRDESNWPGTVIPYCIQNDDKLIALFTKGVSLLKSTVIRFQAPGKDVTDCSMPGHQVKVVISEAGLCASDVGFLHMTYKEKGVRTAWFWHPEVGKQDPKSIDAQPTYLVVEFNLSMHYSDMAHELIHALGFAHMHSRPDRDTFIRANVNLAESVCEINYRVDRFSSSGGNYETRSIMHYSGKDPRCKLPDAMSENVFSLVHPPPASPAAAAAAASVGLSPWSKGLEPLCLGVPVYSPKNKCEKEYFNFVFDISKTDLDAINCAYDGMPEFEHGDASWTFKMKYKIKNMFK